MAQDYWRGGWANQTEMLPGTRAAAMDKGRYGPWNALADIIGAVWKRNAQRGAMKEAEQFVSDFDTNMAPDYEAPSRDMRIGKTADQTDLQALQEQQEPPKPLSYDEYVQKSNDSKGELMRRLVTKYGQENAKTVADMINETVSGRQAAYGDRLAADAANQYYAFANQNPLTQGNYLQHLMLANRANLLSNKLGKGDIINLQDIAKNAANKLTTINQGGYTGVYAAPTNGLPFGYGEDGKPVLMSPVANLPTTLTPAQAASIQLQREENERKQEIENKKYQLEADKWEWMKNHPRGGTSSQTSGNDGVSPQQIAALKAVIKASDDFDENNLDGAENPYKADAEQARRILAQIAGIGGSSGQGNSGGQSGGAWSDEQVGNWIDEAYKAGHTKEEIQAKLRERGYGDRFDGWLWD